MASGGEAASVVRGYLPPDYYDSRQVFKPKPPALTPCDYPNKIDIGSHRSYAILVCRRHRRHHHRAPATRLLQSIYAWMSVHFYVAINVTGEEEQQQTTGNIVVEAYESPGERAYAMAVFRVATEADEQTDRIMRSHGYSSRCGPCPPPLTALLCQSGVMLQSIWQWLSLHRGRLAYMVGAPQLRNTVAIAVAAAAAAAAATCREQSRESLDSTLPAYEPPPPAYSDASAPARLPATQSLPELLLTYGSQEDDGHEQQHQIPVELDGGNTPSTSSNSSDIMVGGGWRIASVIGSHVRRTRLAATTAPDCYPAARRRSQWLWRLLRK
ncbi:hypothetical protein LPJ59_001431 [Coemansia sp. RSA 2399]|nr:hypothetical protein LPJ59_001431 [Coemansia sp. RSA 2399]KAJ1906598.1 hypothetical protein LPJ81_001262 [Coemansia sp. IMI 209127]